MLSGRLSGSAPSLCPLVLLCLSVLCAAANFHPRLLVDDVSSFQAGWQPPAPFLQAQNRTELKMSVEDHVLTLALQGGLPRLLSFSLFYCGSTQRTALTSHLCPSTVFLVVRLDLHRDLRFFFLVYSNDY